MALAQPSTRLGRGGLRPAARHRPGRAPGPRGRPVNRPWTLASSVAGAVVVALDVLALTVAQPSLHRELHATFAEVQWTSTAYLVAVASLLVFAGRLGDRYGQRRVFGLGMLGFGAASVGIGLAPGGGVGDRTARGPGGVRGPVAAGRAGHAAGRVPADRLASPLAVRTGAIGLAAAAAGPLVGGALVTGPGLAGGVLHQRAARARLPGLPALLRPEPGRRAPDPVGTTVPGPAGAALLAVACPAWCTPSPPGPSPARASPCPCWRPPCSSGTSGGRRALLPPGGDRLACGRGGARHPWSPCPRPCSARCSSPQPASSSAAWDSIRSTAPPVQPAAGGAHGAVGRAVPPRCCTGTAPG
ncbi:MFS transporter [Streptomyces tricolor]|nr:MFS transporter [Streptomyces tricolor]